MALFQQMNWKCLEFLSFCFQLWFHFVSPLFFIPTCNLRNTGTQNCWKSKLASPRMYGSRKHPYSPTEGIGISKNKIQKNVWSSIGISRGEGVSKKNPFQRGEVWIFSGFTQCNWSLLLKTGKQQANAVFIITFKSALWLEMF